MFTDFPLYVTFGASRAAHLTAEDRGRAGERPIRRTAPYPRETMVIKEEGRAYASRAAHLTTEGRGRARIAPYPQKNNG